MMDEEVVRNKPEEEKEGIKDRGKKIKEGGRMEE